MPKASSHALEEAELAEILSSAMDAIIAIDESQRVILFNRAAEEMFGCPAAAALGSPIDRFIPERYREKHADHIRVFAEIDVSKRRMGALGDIWGLRADGEEFPIEASIGQVRTSDRTLFTVILRDISQRREAERLLRESLAQSTAVFETAVDGIITIDERGTIESFNRAAERIFGYPAREVLERNVQILMPAPDREDHDGSLEHFLETGEKRIIGIGREVAGLRKDGTTFPLYLAVSENFAGGRRFFTGIVRDLSERVAAEAALAASEARHRALVEHAQVCIHELDSKGHFRSINRCCLEMLGHRDASAVIGQPYLAVVGEIDRSRIAGLIERAVRGESVTYEFEGGGRIFSCSLSPLRDGSGGVAELIGVTQDVTEHR